MRAITKAKVFESNEPIEPEPLEGYTWTLEFVNLVDTRYAIPEPQGDFYVFWHWRADSNELPDAIQELLGD